MQRRKKAGASANATGQVCSKGGNTLHCFMPFANMAFCIGAA